MADHSNSSSWVTWPLLDPKDVKPGHSAILGGHTTIFYGIHITAILTILISIVSCITVIISVVRNAKSKKRQVWDFSDRFPLYLAISDLIWGIAHISGDHGIILIRQTYPDKNYTTILAIYVCVFFGYQQFMNAGLSLYTYLKVVRRISLDLGRWEWKLHASVISLLLFIMAPYVYLEGFGNSGFWFMEDANTKSGRVLGVHVTANCTIHAALTLLAYRSIQNVVNQQKSVLAIYTPSASFDESPSKKKVRTLQKTPSTITDQSQYHSTANKCLTTFVYISLCLYLPFAVSTAIYASFGFFGYIEPLTVWLLVIQANSGGWVNAWGYFRNRKIKEERRDFLVNSVPSVPSNNPDSSTASTNASSSNA